MTPLGIERVAAFSFHKISQASHNQVLTDRILMLKKLNLNSGRGTSLVVQWLRIRLPMQGKQVPSLVREEPTCQGSTKPLVQQLLSTAPARGSY